MSRPNSFQSIWPPEGDDLFDGLPEVRAAKKMYVEQMACLCALADQAIQSTAAEEVRYLSREIVTMLHNISGTAANFGEAAFGAFAGGMERPVLAAQTPDLLHPLCAMIRARLASA